MLATLHQDDYINSTTKGICITEINGKVLLVNDVFGELFKIPERKMIGSKLYRASHIPDSSLFEAYRVFREIQKGDIKRKIKAIRVRNDSMRIHVSIEGSSLQMGNEKVLLITYSFEGICGK